MLCPNCGTFCEDGEQVCRSCGALLTAMPDDGQQSAGVYDGQTVMIDRSALAEPVAQAMYIQQDPYAGDMYGENQPAPAKYKRGIAVCLILAFLFVCGAVALLVLSTSDKEEKQVAEETIEENMQAGLVGTWARDGDYAVFTSDGRFAVPNNKGEYALSGSDILLSTAGSYSVASYSVEDGELTVSVSGVGTEHEYKYFFLSPRIDLKPSEIEKLWNDMR